MIRADRLHRESPAGRVWRVGRKPSPWDWVSWRFANEDTRTFDGRWDSPGSGAYRTIYAAATPENALLEVLARFRPDPVLSAAMAEIEVETVDGHLYATEDAGVVPDDWFDKRALTSADLAGSFCDVAHSATIAELRREFGAWVIAAHGLEDLDLSALQNDSVRPLTQVISAALYALANDDGGPAVEGIRFLSRFGVDHELWTVFEQADDGERSARLGGIEELAV